MPLDSLTFNNNITWSMSKANTGYADTKNGPTSASFSLSGVDIANYNYLYVASLTVAPSATTTIDLSSLTSLLGEAINFTKVLTIVVTTTGNQITVATGATNGLVWFFGGTSPTITIPTGGMFAFSEAATSTGTTVDATHKTLKFTNNGATTNATVKVQILGKV